MALRCLPGAVLLLCACTTGPPFGDDLAGVHRDPFPAASEREARFARTEHFSSPAACLGHLARIGEVVRLSSYEALAHRTISHEGRPTTEEHHCALATLRIRAWYGEGRSTAHH